MEKKKCVIVGTGTRGTGSYIEPIVRGHLSDCCELLGVYDAVHSRAKIISENFGVPYYTDFEEMLNAVKPDFVIVTTKDSAHHEYIIRALEAGFDVVSEKPMTESRKNALAIMEAEKRTGHKVLVTFNMRYMRPIEDLKRVIQSGVIGEVRHVELSWLLDRRHGADYFRRWHRYMENSNSLLLHKSTHHFDCINWILEKKPASVFARNTLEFYGKNGPYRGEYCRKCEHTECPLRLNIPKGSFEDCYLIATEEESKYYRDGCVFAEDIDIYDRMALNVLYEDGTTMNYSLVAYSPDEGYRMRFIGTEGRVEFENMGGGVTVIDELAEKGANVSGDGNLLIHVKPLHGEEQWIRTGFDTGAHGGGDNKMRDDIFRAHDENDPLRHFAPSIEGYYSLAIGDMAVLSSKTGRAIAIDELS